jgi:hypothetical protein
VRRTDASAFQTTTVGLNATWRSKLTKLRIGAILCSAVKSLSPDELHERGRRFSPYSADFSRGQADSKKLIVSCIELACAKLGDPLPAHDVVDCSIACVGDHDTFVIADEQFCRAVRLHEGLSARVYDIFIFI